MIYLDHAATTPLDERVLEAMLPALNGRYGNAASPHQAGRAARRAVEHAREQVAALVGVRSSRVVWTSGSTEAINTALKALGQTTVATWEAEHKAVLDTVEWLAQRGVEVVKFASDSGGRPLWQETEADLTVLMAANNETGIVVDVPAVAQDVAEREGALFVDFTQAAGRTSFGLGGLPGDICGCISSHKIYGPQGIGALILPPAHRDRVTPLIHGGGHERGHRSGTLNVAGIIGFGAAAELAADAATDQHVQALRDRLEQSLLDLISDVRINSNTEPRLPHISSITIDGVDAEMLIANAPDVAFATGSACTSSVPTPSHVLISMGLTTEEAEQTARFSVGRHTTIGEIDAAVDSITSAAGRVRSLL